jgi:hypothetical protein
MELESYSPYPQAPAIFYGFVILPLETLPPPGDPNGGVVYLRNVLSPEEASLMGNSEFLLLFENAALVKKI